jgi:hypothetical protein
MHYLSIFLNLNNVLKSIYYSKHYFFFTFFALAYHVGETEMSSQALIVTCVIATGVFYIFLQVLMLYTIAVFRSKFPVNLS